MIISIIMIIVVIIQIIIIMIIIKKGLLNKHEYWTGTEKLTGRQNQEQELDQDKA